MADKHLEVDLSSKTAIVTGGSRGIGKAIALALAGAGANVVVAARTEDDAASLPGTIHRTVEEVGALGGKALAVRCDVTDTGDVDAMVAAATSAFGAVDILVNNAGLLHGPTFGDTDPEDAERLLRVNVLGPFLCTRAVLPQMAGHKTGSIVNISSGLAQSTHPGNNVYSASKAALDRMMLKLAGEVAGDNIAVNLVYPGMIRSEGIVSRVPREMADGLPAPSVVGPPVVWLAAQDASSFTGRIVQVSSFGTEWP